MEFILKQVKVTQYLKLLCLWMYIDVIFFQEKKRINEYVLNEAEIFIPVRSMLF